MHSLTGQRPTRAIELAACGLNQIMSSQLVSNQQYAQFIRHAVHHPHNFNVLACPAATDLSKRSRSPPHTERSARSTFPDLANFRPARLAGWRRVFAHTADVFFARGIARPETGEISSLSCEPCEGAQLVVALFEVGVQ